MIEYKNRREDPYNIYAFVEDLLPLENNEYIT